ncbi:carboxyl-terminal peptidase [Medicago truncatula]|uniref:Carboxyl-terminal peptidase n=2 Tax=Medicago truncatula TaxID=3880 RepID=G7J4W2_MEDTR|nr:carboxyl-terminal peptidase [Medicago truncatula]
MEAKEYSVSLKRHRKEPYFVAHHTKRQHHIASKQACTHNHSLILSTSQNTPPMLPVFVSLLLLLLTSTTPALSHHSIVSDSIHPSKTNQTYKAGSELLKLRRIRTHLMKINKPAVKTIQSPDGDLIDCILSHHQPAFDHPKLKGHKPLDPPERPNGYYNNGEKVSERLQLWTDSGEECPEGTVPIRRTTEDDILRASSIKRFGRKPKPVRRDSTSSDHEHAILFVNGNQYFGAKANINVWAPHVTDGYEFSLSQIWVIAGSFGNDLNTLEAGWQVSPELYGDNYPRFFTYWTTDAYQTTGCYNLLCSGFIQTNNKIAIGATISPTSAYNSGQFDIGIMIWKDPKHGHWWLEYGGQLVGYWPANMFSHLRSHASMVQFGGEIVNARSKGYHTDTQMGSGHFAEEGFKKAAYFRNLQVIDWDNNLLPLANIQHLADHSSCYNIKQGNNNVWGTYFYYGGPGRNVKCP